MFGGTKIKIDKDLLDKAEKAASVGGYASVGEFIHHVLERELSHFDDAASDEEIKAKLKGLGYIS